MTMPAEPGTGSTGAPGTGDPSNEPTEPTGQQPATGEGGTGNEPSDGSWDSIDWDGLSPAEVREKLDHARTWEKRAKANKDKLDKLTAPKATSSTPKPGDQPGTDEAQTRIAEADRAREAAEERAAELAYTSAVSRIAPKAGADADLLLDSDRFRRAVGDELDDGFDDDELTAAVEKVARRFVKKEPRFAGTRPTPPRGSGEFSGSPGTGTPITEEQLATMTPDQIAQAFSDGKLKHLL